MPNHKKPTGYFTVDGKATPKRVKEFYWQLCTKTVSAIKNYYKNNGGNHPTRHYSEQINKAFLCIALNSITETCFLQELPISRNETSKGRLDFIAHHNKTSYLLKLLQLQ